MTRRAAIDLFQLELQSLDQLRQTWSTYVLDPVPPLQTRRLLALALGHRLQAQWDGGLTGNVRRRLAELDRRFRADPNYVPPPVPILRPGCSVIKDWNGERHEVRVLEQGFAYRGAIYGSLSEVASHITGTHRSGPRFFGLKKRAR